MSDAMIIEEVNDAFNPQAAVVQEATGVYTPEPEVQEEDPKESQEEREDREEEQAEEAEIDEEAFDLMSSYWFRSSMYVAMFLMGSVFPVYGLYVLYQAMGMNVATPGQDIELAPPATISNTFMTLMRFQTGIGTRNAREIHQPEVNSKHFSGNKYRPKIPVPSFEQLSRAGPVDAGHAPRSAPATINLGAERRTDYAKEMSAQRTYAQAKRTPQVEEGSSVYRPSANSVSMI
eukprot:CAMPEP_0197864224 /NCGR_PEP_ID=MMETSP1438-20131217/42308_1 /TAXON_ID=1461541 /ORGANISM="Pterosperma sp., Strain CCMP1384" /LENGTH=232 /DNA_ID=CAMNT_0043482389 /DNA_START=132 /DNA_END=830 /DNA_ORIENTATION=+